MFSPEVLANFLISMKIMWMGMLGIFAVIIVIMIVVTILTKIGAKSSQAEE